MRKPLLFLFFALCASTAAHASDGKSCRTHATLAAEEWTENNLISGSEASRMEPAPLLIIAYGHTYGVVRNAINPETLQSGTLGSLIVKRNQVYQEELDRCLGRFTVEIVVVEADTYEHKFERHPGHK